MSYLISINGTGAADLPLQSIVVGRASSLDLVVSNVPENVDNVQLHFTRPGNAEATAAGANPAPGGIWKAYVNGAYFPREGTAQFYVTGRDARGGSVFLGSGWVRVVPSVLNVSDAPVPTLPEDVYLRGTNGLYYPITVDFDSDGVPMPVIGEGITK